MRFSVHWIAFAAVGATSACAVISGLDDYQPGFGSTSSTGSFTNDASGDGVVPDGATTVVPIDDGSSSDATAIAPTDAPVDIGDAPAACGPKTCQQCCRNGSCVGGGSVDSCGVGGAECQDCTSSGGACSNGACTTKVVDASGPPACNAAKCGGCAPVWEGACCKSDGTCGCAMAFGSGPCQ